MLHGVLQYLSSRESDQTVASRNRNPVSAVGRFRWCPGDYFRWPNLVLL